MVDYWVNALYIRHSERTESSQRHWVRIVRFEEIEQALRQRLEAFPPAARAELLHAFPPDFDRIDRIGSYYGNRRARL